MTFTEVREMDPDVFAPPAHDEAVRASAAGGGAEDGLVLASRTSRLLAYMADNAISVIGVFPLAIVAIVRAEATGVTFDPRDLTQGMTQLVVGLGVAWYLGVTCFNWYLIATRGQTLGKRLMGTRIVLLDGSQVTFSDGVIMRNWVLGLGGAVLDLAGVGQLLRLVDALFIFGGQRRCLHDMLAGTKVVNAVHQRQREAVPEVW